ncbi:MAG TPA: hypothetical protein VJT32_00785 [bacterium]|nr:hypothetical protein [bacterium]
MARLLDAYAGLLTAHQQAMMRMYYHDDLSLGEIAGRFDVTRQAVFDSLRRSVTELRSIEARVGLLAVLDRQARARGVLEERLADVERQVEQLGRDAGGALGGLRNALRALRDAL